MASPVSYLPKAACSSPHTPVLAGAKTLPTDGDADHPDGQTMVRPNPLLLTSVSGPGSSTGLMHILEERELASLNVLSLAEDINTQRSRLRFREGVRVPLVGELRWRDLWHHLKIWSRQPVNLALVIWCLLAVIAGITSMLIQIGAFDGWVKRSAHRDSLNEVCNQVLNSLFVLMSLVFHPLFFRHAFLLYRWKASDIKEMRCEYNKNGTRKKNEWPHMLITLCLFHLGCFATYSLALLFWIKKRKNRSIAAVAVTTASSIAFPILGFVYNLLCPLGRDPEGEGVGGLARASTPTSNRHIIEAALFAATHTLVDHPVWHGRVVLDACSNPRVALVTAVCPLCVFGNNMERVGYGPRLVQTVTFLLLLVGPCCVFLLSAATMRPNSKWRRLMLITGLALTVLGILYGACWRWRLRRDFGLPGARWMCWSPWLTDAATWLFCPILALCQEVRTAEQYVVRDWKFYERSAGEGREDLEVGVRDVAQIAPACSSSSSSSSSSSKGMEEWRKGRDGEDGSSEGALIEAPKVFTMEVNGDCR